MTCPLTLQRILSVPVKLWTAILLLGHLLSAAVLCLSGNAEARTLSLMMLIFTCIIIVVLLGHWIYDSTEISIAARVLWGGLGLVLESGFVGGVLYSIDWQRP